MNHNVRILVAEDDPGHRELICRNFRRVGIDNPILEFEDGQKILDYLQSCRGEIRPDEEPLMVLVLDIRMPKIDGLEVLRRIKNDPVLHSLPVVVLTTTDDPSDIRRCHRLGCSSYITKPIEYDAFLEAVQRLGRFLDIIQVPSIGTTH